MSLINKMLQDLDERRSGTDALGALHGQVRAAPVSPSRGIPAWIVVSLVGVVAAVGAAAWWMQVRPEEKPAMAMAQQSAPAASLGLKLDHTPLQLPEMPVSEPVSAAIEIDGALGHAQPDKTRNESDGDDMPRVQARTGQASAIATHAAQQSTAQPALPPEVKSQVPEMRTASPSSPSKGAADSRQALMGSGMAEKGANKLPSSKQKARAAEPTEFSNEIEAVQVKVSKQVKELTPQQRAENEYRRALTLVEQAKTSEAMAALEQALQIDSRHAGARQTLAALLIEAKRPGDALRSLNEGLSGDRAQTGMAMMQARLQVDQQDTHAAIDTLQRSLPYAMDRADYRAFLAALLQREARHKDAIEHYLAALKRTPNNGIWWMGLGISLQAENRLPEARDAYTRAKMSGNLSPELMAFVDQKLGQAR